MRAALLLCFLLGACAGDEAVIVWCIDCGDGEVCYETKARCIEAGLANGLDPDEAEMECIAEAWHGYDD